MPPDEATSSHGPTVEVDVVPLAAPIDPTAQAREQYLGTRYDQRDMWRMGKRQELRRDFQFFSIWGYALILSSTWEWGLVSGAFSLTNGGTAGGVWMFVVACSGMFFVTLSMAEMVRRLRPRAHEQTRQRMLIRAQASMAPTSGGQYHWVSELSPRRYQRVFSYVTGWFALLGWQSALVGTAYGAGQQFEAIAALSMPTYETKGWHGCLFTIALTGLAIPFNTALYRRLPQAEGIVILLNIFGFMAVLVVLWVMAPRGGPETVTAFETNGWDSVGLSCLVGLSSPIFVLIGADAQCHLSEELYNAAYVLPRAMVATSIINYLMGFVMVLTVMFTVGRRGQRPAHPARHAMGADHVQRHGLIHRQHDLRMPGRLAAHMLLDQQRHGSLATAMVRPGWDVPLNAMLCTFGICAVLSLFAIGSPVAWELLTSLPLVGLTSSYLLAIGCVFWRRLRGEPLPLSRFPLGRFGLVCNGVALAFLGVVWIFIFFPTAPDPGARGMNWAVVIYALVIILFSAYFWKARKTYVGPVVYVRKDLDVGCTQD
ncbi:Amino acid permease [Teratosphaeria destructans]|uniref:Amino acid permease n=1 Tax=Teratosphaeria destructans TaxID=418781 RepID=A0A9W7SPV7_9PEZI|nr:Amino acid permease [Teratosphaeria destructans]